MNFTADEAVNQNAETFVFISKSFRVCNFALAEFCIITDLKFS